MEDSRDNASQTGNKGQGSQNMIARTGRLKPGNGDGTTMARQQTVGRTFISMEYIYPEIKRDWRPLSPSAWAGWGGVET